MKSGIFGVALERGLFKDCGNTSNASKDGRELHDAADIYAGLHRQVWGRLDDDIESAITRRWGHRAFELLLEVGDVKAPAAPASHFRQLVAGTASPPGESDPGKYLLKRQRLADRYGEAREQLTRTSLTALLIVENVVIEGMKPCFLCAPGTPLTARSIELQEAFVAGLKALADHFGLFDHRETRRQRAARGEGVACS